MSNGYLQSLSKWEEDPLDNITVLWGETIMFNIFCRNRQNKCLGLCLLGWLSQTNLTTNFVPYSILEFCSLKLTMNEYQEFVLSVNLGSFGAVNLLFTHTVHEPLKWVQLNYILYLWCHDRRDGVVKEKSHPGKWEGFTRNGRVESLFIMASP